ncbi:coiled-coil domain-containing protein 50 isoform X1 [Scleropages formosus]|uniref:Coiled-coil domain-containing protein n=1 Tax=Scleropages formosus TaxID=113540 RepID=A0A8C9RL88_SCLFO|nr:coiled-coil domain-containing protein 50 isoform X1 [Scleropages formosus]
MADLGIDKNSLPGVKEVCRDFAVLEDHTLAYSLQEQEIENHLASNIHKSRLVQQDLQVAKRLQEEEDLRAKAHIQRQHKDIERSDNEIAQEIQEQLVRQAEQQRQQEEKDEAIARMLQEKEMKEERRRQKQLEAHYEEDYYEEKGASRPRDRNKGRYPECEPAEYDQNERPCHSPSEGSRDKRHKYDLPEGQQSECYEQKNSKHKRDNFSECFPIDSNRSTYPPHEPSCQRRDKLHRTQDWPAEAAGAHSDLCAVSGDLGGTQGSGDVEMVVRRKERQVSREREKERKREANGVRYREREGGRDRGHNLDWERDYNMRTEWDKDRERQRERNYNKQNGGERPKETDCSIERTKDRERRKERDYNVEMDRERHKNRVHNVGMDRERYKERDCIVGREKNKEKHTERDYNVERNRERDYNVERDREKDRATNKKDRERDYSLNTEREKDGERHGETHHSIERDAARDRHRNRGNSGERLKDRERHKDGHNRGTDRAVPSTSHVSLADMPTDEDRWTDRPRIHSWDDEMLEELSPKTQRRRERRGHRDRHEEFARARSHTREDSPPPHSPREPGRKVRGEYGMREATQGVSRMDLREQELKDLEVARKLQEEELKSSQVDKRAAQVAQDEEIARLLMEEEKRVYKRSRDREKPCMDRRPEGDGKPGYEEVVRPRSRDEYYQKPRNHKAERPPSRGHDYENVDSSYLYPAAHHPSRASPGPETTYKGSYNRQ